MSDISYGVQLTINKGFLDNRVQVNNVTATMSLEGMNSLTYTLTTNAVAVNTAGLSSVGMAFLRNLSTATASTAQIGIDQGGSFVGLASLRAGEPALFRLAAGTDYQLIGTAGTRLRVDITEG
jgi:DNA-binding IclR family transcriptional regulator